MQSMTQKRSKNSLVSNYTKFAKKPKKKKGDEKKKKKYKEIHTAGSSEVETKIFGNLSTSYFLCEVEKYFQQNERQWTQRKQMKR